MLVYVDDIIISGSNMDGIEQLQALLNSSFHMKDPRNIQGTLHILWG